MTLERFEKNMDVIAKLDDEPNDAGSLTAAELKAKFDEGGVALKEYINDVLIPTLKSSAAASELGAMEGPNPSNVQAAIDSVQRQIADVVLEQIPDYSITPKKLAWEPELPFILWLYTLGYPMTPEQMEAVEGNPSLMEIFNNSRLTPATKEEAEAGEDNSKLMTPQRTREAIESIGGVVEDQIGRKGTIYVDTAAPNSTILTVDTLGQGIAVGPQTATSGNVFACCEYLGGNPSNRVYLRVIDLNTGNTLYRHRVGRDVYIAVETYGAVGVLPDGNLLACCTAGHIVVSNTTGEIVYRKDYPTQLGQAHFCYGFYMAPLDNERYAVYSTWSQNNSGGLYLIVNGIVRTPHSATNFNMLNGQLFHRFDPDTNILYMPYRDSNSIKLGKFLISTASGGGGVSLVASSGNLAGANYSSIVGVMDETAAYMSPMYSNTTYIKPAKVILSTMETIVVDTTIFAGQRVFCYQDDSYFYLAATYSTQGPIVDRIFVFIKDNFITPTSKTSIGGVYVTAITALTGFASAYVVRKKGNIYSMETIQYNDKFMAMGGVILTLPDISWTLPSVGNVIELMGKIAITAGQNGVIGILNLNLRALKAFELKEPNTWEV